VTRRRLALRVEEKPAAADRREIHRRLRAFNAEQVGRPLNLREFSVFVRDGDGTIVGGVNGVTYWNWLFVEQLWLDESLRRRGWGRRLMAAAERVALDRGCTGAWVDTMSFQAPGFYRRLGYRQFGELPDHPTGSSQMWFWKPLARQASRRRPARRK
jgi:GNAT superfamily N-acetyltransferase